MPEKPGKQERSRQHPRLLPSITDDNLATEDQLLSGRRIEDLIFREIDLSSQRLPELIGSSLLLERVSFANSEIRSTHWTDMRLVRCDLSNAIFRNFTATRVEFVDCKLVGLNAPACKWQDVLLDHCDARFAQLSEGRVRHCEFRSTQLRESALNRIDLEGTQFHDTVLRQADLAGTSLQNIDLRSCDIEGISLRAEDLRGAIVTAAQAMEVVRFLGVVIR